MVMGWCRGVKNHPQNVSCHQISFLSLTSAWRRSGSTVELLRPPLCLGQGDPCNIFAWLYAQEWTHHSNPDISVVYVVFLSYLVIHETIVSISALVPFIFQLPPTKNLRGWGTVLWETSIQKPPIQRQINLIQTNALKQLSLNPRR